MEISLEYYRTFYHVARLGSLTRAAAELSRSQPNLTKAIGNLESQLGCKLFVRRARGMTLTPEGEKLYAHISAAMRQIEAGEKAVLLDRSLQSGTLNLAAGEIGLRCCLMPVLERFRSRYPHVRIRLAGCSAPQAIETLKNGLADLAVVAAPYPVPEALRRVELLRVREAAVCGEAFSDLWNRTVRLPELESYPVISMRAETTTYQFLRAYFAENGTGFAPDIEVSSADQVLPLVRCGLGIGFLPEQFLSREPSLEGVRRLKMDRPLPERPVCLLKRRDGSLGVAAKELERMLLEGGD